mmetsp:Transcript_3862/g.9607  ORF Transcript_3862/g.9607 Transcript_3862/m.9607 type:complete len:91 (-) Transcript_3862:1537-1809(-)
MEVGLPRGGELTIGTVEPLVHLLQLYAEHLEWETERDEQAAKWVALLDRVAARLRGFAEGMESAGKRKWRKGGQKGSAKYGMQVLRVNLA